MIALIALRVLFAIAIFVVVFASSVMILVGDNPRVASDKTTGARPTGFNRRHFDVLCCRAFQGAGTLWTPAVEASPNTASITAHRSASRTDAGFRHIRVLSEERALRDDLLARWPSSRHQIGARVSRSRICIAI